MRELDITANPACRFIVFVGVTSLTFYQLSEWLRCQSQPLSSLVMSQLCGLISPGKYYFSYLLFQGSTFVGVTIMNILNVARRRTLRPKHILQKIGKDPRSKCHIDVFLLSNPDSEFLFLSSQQTIDGFTVIKKKPPPPVTKAGMTEYILELIVDGDLVSNSFITGCL